MRLISRTISLLSNSIKVNTNQVKSHSKRLTSEYVVPLTQETLTGRLLLYLNIDKENPVKNNTEIVRNVRQNMKRLRKLNTEEIIQFSRGLRQEKCSNEVGLFRKLDKECYLRLPDLKVGDILRLLNIYMGIVSNRMTQFSLYKKGMEILFSSVEVLDKKDLLQFMFFVGLQKKTSKAQNMLRRCIKLMHKNFVTGLTGEELCVICNATFKTSTKITNRFLLNKIRDYMNDNLFILKDTALFVTLVKTIRHNRFQDENLLNTISHAVQFNKTINSYSFSTICHLMALYADYFYYDHNLLKLFSKTCLEQLDKSTFNGKKLHMEEQLRGKDIKRFLWALGMFSELKIIETRDVKNVIIPKLIERIEGKEFEDDPESIIEMFLYLWMLNYRPYELVPYLQQLSPQSYTNSKLNLLLHSIQVEDPDLAKQLLLKPAHVPPYSQEYQINKRPLIERLFSNLQVIKNQLDLSDFKVNQSILPVNIMGITGYRNDQKAVYVEILDDYTKLKNIEDVPVGLMALKLRLLNKSEEGVLVVSQMEIEDMTDGELREFLLDEIKLIC